MNKQTENSRSKLGQSEEQVARLQSQLDSVHLSMQTSLSKEAVHKLEEQNTKLQVVCC